MPARRPMKIEIPEQKKFVHECVIPIRWGDMDAMNHVNNTNYFRYLETARIDWMAQSGMMPKGGAGEGWVIANAFCNFIRQLEFPGDVRVRTYVSNPGRVTLDTWATIERTDEPGVVYAAGGATLIWVDFAAQKARTMPDWVRALAD